jgi:hypothetical protein
VPVLVVVEEGVPAIISGSGGYGVSVVVDEGVLEGERLAVGGEVDADLDCWQPAIPAISAVVNRNRRRVQSIPQTTSTGIMKLLIEIDNVC